MSETKKRRFNTTGFIKYFDYGAIIFGVLALVSNIAIDCPCLNNALCIVAAILWLGYFTAGIVILVRSAPKLDWILGNGHFLRKVIAFVLLCPFFVASLFVVPDCLDKDYNFSPKNLLYENNLYPDAQKLADPGIAEQKSPSIFATVFYHFIDPGNQHMTTSYKGRAIATLIGIMGVFLLNGLLVSFIVGWIDSRREKWLKGEVRYKRFLSRKKHYVIIGGHDSVVGIVRQLLKETGYILIQTSCDVEEFRRELFSNLKANQQQRIIIYYGHRTSERDIRSLRLEMAKEVYILGEETRADDIESYHDTRNMKALLLAKDYLQDQHSYKTDKAKLDDIINGIKPFKEKINELNDDIKALEDKTELSEADNSRLEDLRQKQIEAKAEFARRDAERKAQEKVLFNKAVVCRVMFEYQTSFSVFQFSEISDDIKYCIKFKPFNYYEMWAQKVLVNKDLKGQSTTKECSKKTAYLPLEGIEGIGPDSDRYVHLFIVGMSRMGVVMGIEAAHLAHYPNFGTKNIRTKITFIDKDSAEEKDFFMGRFKNLFELSHWRYGTVTEDNGKNSGEGELQWTQNHAPENCAYLGGDFLDIEWEFINGGIENRSVKKYICEEVSKTNSLATVALCLPEPSRCLAAALYLGRDVYEKAEQILVYNRYGDSLVNEMTHCSDNQMNPYNNKLKPFGMASECYDATIISDAELIGGALGHEYDELYDFYKDKYGTPDEGDGLGKSAVAKWWSNIYNANSLWSKLRCIGWDGNGTLSDRQVDILAATEHARWNMEQLLLGYRPLTDAEQKEVIADLKQKNQKKGRLAHFDICSFQRLAEIDRYALHFDTGLSKILPEVYQKLEMMK